MTDLMITLASFTQPIGLTAILVILYGCFSRSNTSLRTTQVIMGTVFGFAAIVAMSSPIEVAKGVIFDMRNLFVGISAAFFAWRGGLLTLAIAVAMRLQIGGEGAEAGVMSAGVSSIMGLIWHSYISPKISNILISLPILASMISLNLVTALMLPAPIAAIILRDIAPLAVALYFGGTALFSILIYREIALVEEANRLLQDASTDPLTLVLNRRSAIDIYNSDIRKAATNTGVAMACIDIDHFKQINDVYGHLAGDKVLICTAKRIAKCLRKHDILCRMSGDEFLIVMNNVTHLEASSISERCRANVCETAIEFDGKPMSTTISIGTAWARTAPDFNAFRNASDEALYLAKSMGRDCSSFIVHEPESHAA